ncbi:MAG: hypothetical protein AB7O59_05810 [Pirellulales bacterium]
MPRSAVDSPGTATLDDYRWLTGEGAAELLQSLAANARPTHELVNLLRRTLSPARAHLIAQQIELRRRARTKFAAAERMFFTSLGLEQASDEIVAAYKARRMAGQGDVQDLCCGIGGDLLALAARGRAVGVERDPAVAVLAAANLRAVAPPESAALSVAPSDVVVCDAIDADVGACAAWHIDPDRRPTGRRTTRVELHEPGPAVIETLLARNGNAALKLAPAAVLPDGWSEQAEMEWISRGGECRQLVAWFGKLATHTGQRRATVLGSDGVAPRTILGIPCEEPPPASSVGRFVCEPDAAVLAAQLAGNLAAEHGLWRIAPGIAYWTGDAAVADPALACFEVEDVLPLDVKRVRALLRDRQIGRLEIKKRGVDCDPETLRKQFKLAGENAATLIVTRVRGRVTAILARRS